MQTDSLLNYKIKTIKGSTYSIPVGHYMYAHSNSDTKEFSLRSPAELNYTCLMFIFNLNVSTARTRLDLDHLTPSHL